MGAPSTQSESVYEPAAEGRKVPGVLLVFSGNAPMLRPIRVADAPLRLGRDDAGGAPLPDEKVSRMHCELSFDAPGWSIRDLDSRNGSFLNGVKLGGVDPRAASGQVLRLANSLFILCDDVRPFEAGSINTEGAMIIGPTLRAALDRVADAARRDANLLVFGETGAGKELAARTYHEASGKKGPLVAVNCSNIPALLAERLLFGAVKGAFTDIKADVEGHVQAAEGGSLFLDELGELSMDVQPKLLRVVEQREVTRLGDNQARKVNVRFVGATHRDLRAAADRGDFRHDLWHRLSQDYVELPPLRQRREEIPWLINAGLADQPVRVAHVSLVEAAIIRHWPGNVRELLKEVRRAAVKAHGEGSRSVRALHLDPDAGISAGRPEPKVRVATEAAPASKKWPTKEEVDQVFTMTGQNKAATAKHFGLHREQLYRLMKKYGLIAAKDDGDESDGDDAQ